MNLLHTVFLELDVEHRKMLINYFNERILKKYYHLQKKIGTDLCRELIAYDPYFLSPKKLNNPVLNPYLNFKFIQNITMNKNSTLTIFKDWMGGDCNGATFFDGYKENVMYDYYYRDRDDMNRTLLGNCKNISNFLDKGLIILSVFDNTYFIIFYKVDDNVYNIISTLDEFID